MIDKSVAAGVVNGDATIPSESLSEVEHDLRDLAATAFEVYAKLTARADHLLDVIVNREVVGEQPAVTISDGSPSERDA